GSGVEKAGTRLRLQAAGHGGPALAQARRRPAPPPGASGGEVQRRHHAGAARSRRAEGGRLITLDPQLLRIPRRRARPESLRSLQSIRSFFARGPLVWSIEDERGRLAGSP